MRTMCSPYVAWQDTKKEEIAGARGSTWDCQRLDSCRTLSIEVELTAALATGPPSSPRISTLPIPARQTAHRPP